MKSIKDKKKDFPKVNFIGNKEKIADWICDNFPKDVTSVLDVFSGGSSVGYLAKTKGYKVISNDVLKINYLIAKSLVENNKIKLTDDDIEIIFSGKPRKGFMYKNYSNKLFFPSECMELDSYRLNIEKLDSEFKKSLALTLIRRSMIRKLPYSRTNLSWDKIKILRDEEYSYKKYKRRRAYHNRSFREHFLENLTDYNNSIFDNKKRNKAINKDVFSVLGKIKADLVYLDPPYTGTMNNYFGFYGVFDEYVDSQKKDPFENNFMDKQKSLELFDKLFSRLEKYKYWVLSYNNNSYPSKKDLTNLIKKYRKNVKILEKKHNYKITGSEKKNNNKEYLFLISN